MSETAAPATNAAPAPEAVASPPAAPPKDRSAALIQKAVKAQQKMHAEEAQRELEGSAEPADKGTPGRDPETGKFLPAGAKPKPAPKPKTDTKSLRADAGPGGPHTPAEPGATPGPATEEEKPGPSADSKARRLVKEGKIAEAMKTIGLDPSHLEGPKWAKWRHQNDKIAAAITERTQQVERERAEVQTVANRLIQDFRPFIQAKQAFEKGDYEEAFQHAFGIDLNSFQRKALQSMTQPGVAKDPVIAELRKEIASLREERKQEREQMTQAQQQAERQQRAQSLWNGNVEALAESGDPRMAELSKNTKFMRMVWAIQDQSYDKSTDTWTPAVEAAEQALERLQSEYSEWTQVFGGASASSDENATRTRPNPAATGPSGTSARRTAHAVTTLNPAEAAEAAPTVKLKGKALIDYYSRRAAADELRSKVG
jgi:hypothetical protein